MEFPIELSGKALMDAIRTKYPGLSISDVLNLARIHEAQKVHAAICSENLSAATQILVRIHDWNLNLEDFTYVLRLFSMDEECPHANFISKLIDSEFLGVMYDLTRPPPIEKEPTCGCFSSSSRSGRHRDRAPHRPSPGKGTKGTGR